MEQMIEIVKKSIIICLRSGVIGVIISLLGVFILVSTISKITNDFGYLIIFSAGMGLSVGPIVGWVLSTLIKGKSK